jgi:hypothetical protein
VFKPICFYFDPESGMALQFNMCILLKSSLLVQAYLGQ